MKPLNGLQGRSLGRICNPTARSKGICKSA